MLLVARAQSLSGRPGDALVMLERVGAQGKIPADVASDPEFARVRALPRWGEVSGALLGKRPVPSRLRTRPAFPKAEAAKPDAPRTAPTKPEPEKPAAPKPAATPEPVKPEPPKPRPAKPRAAKTEAPKPEPKDAKREG